MPIPGIRHGDFCGVASDCAPVTVILPTGVGEFGGVIEDVAHHLGETGGVSIDPKRTIGQIEGQGQAVLLHSAVEAFHGVADHLDKIDPLLAEPDLPSGIRDTSRRIIDQVAM